MDWVLLWDELSSWPELLSTARALPPRHQWSREICSPAAKRDLNYLWNRASLLPEFRETSHGAFCSCSHRLPSLTAGQRRSWSGAHQRLQLLPSPTSQALPPTPRPQQQGAIPTETKFLANSLSTRNPFWGQRRKGSPFRRQGRLLWAVLEAGSTALCQLSISTVRDRPPCGGCTRQDQFGGTSDNSGQEGHKWKDTRNTFIS